MPSTGKISYRFSNVIWKHSGNAGWFFVSLPEELSQEIKSNLGHEEEGWGRLKCDAETVQSKWTTAIWWDTKRRTYLLPIKSEIRKKGDLKEGSLIEMILHI